MAEKTLEQLTPEETIGMSAEQIVAALGGIADAQILKDGFYTKTWGETVAAMPKVPILIPTPDNWNSPHPYVKGFQVNGMSLFVEGDVLTYVPETFYLVWKNALELEALGRSHRANAKRRMGYVNIAEVPHY